jgi:hypothetical protein
MFAQDCEKEKPTLLFNPLAPSPSVAGLKAEANSVTRIALVRDNVASFQDLP